MRLSITRVTLPAEPTVSCQMLLMCLGGVTRQALHRWRAKGFPRSLRDGKQGYYSTDQVAQWLTDQGVSVVRK